jgi:kinesin family protein 18/19
VVINSISELKTVLKVGNKNRTKERTGCNEASSRSHGIFQIGVEVRNIAQSTVEETVGSKLVMVDLAGSERGANTTNRGMRMVEGAKINQSLLVLGNCIKALSSASEKGVTNPFVPYRGSKLTRLLKDSLGGNCRTVMIAHVSPSVSLY